jgi:putative ATP-dependent endonuclease of OLD family
MEADRNLHYQLGYSSKWTLLSRLMQRFHKALNARADVRAELERLFQQVKAKFGSVPEFSDFVRVLRDQLSDLVSSMTHRLEVDFEAYNPVNFFHALRLHAAEGDAPRTLDEMGTGEQQVLAMAFAYAYAKAFHGGIVLVIEEPEAHLHPLAQEWLAKRLTAMARDGLQLLITTHSPAFVDVLSLEGIVLVRKDDGSTKTTQLDRTSLANCCVEMGAPAGRTRADNILPFYASSATREILAGFFSKAAVLVEGPTEELALPVYLEKCGLQVAKEGIAVISVHGKGNLAKWRRLFTAYGIPCYLVFDNDVRRDEDGSRRRDALQSAGILGEDQVPYISAEDWVVEPGFAIFGSNFEVVLRSNFGSYRDLENAARAFGIESKPFLARQVAERLERNDRDAGWAKFDSLAGKIRSLVRVPVGSAEAAEDPGEEPPF